MIKVKHLNKAFGSIPVLRDLNLTVNGPLVLMGPSGCGKTTLLRILMGLETPDSGTVQGVGNIGAVFQESRLCPQLTAVGNICLVGGVNPAQAQAELQTLGFTQAELALPVARLSGGQQRRTALLRALLCQPVQTLLLDEPFTGMDPELVSHAAVGGAAGRQAGYRAGDPRRTRRRSAGVAGGSAGNSWKIKGLLSNKGAASSAGSGNPALPRF